LFFFVRNVVVWRSRLEWRFFLICHSDSSDKSELVSLATSLRSSSELTRSCFSIIVARVQYPLFSKQVEQ
jgi:hypothetical protein